MDSQKALQIHDDLGGHVLKDERDDFLWHLQEQS